MADAGTPASPEHQSSGSSTNPNTPRSATPEEPEPTNDARTDEFSSPNSSSSGERRFDIEPSWPKEFDITKTPARASWKNHCLSNLLFDLHWNQRSGKAFFSLRTTILSVKGSGRRGAKTGIYLFIYPERIGQLRIDTDPTQKPFGFETLELHFDLIRPPALVLPKTSCEPKTKTAKDVMTAFRNLASHTSFILHAEIPRKKLSSIRAQQLCEAATGSSLASLDAHASTARLYQGQGGRVVEGEDIVHDADASENDEPLPPPQYCETSVARPSAAHISESGGKKRRRLSSSPEPVQEATHKALKALLDLSMLSLKQHIDDRLDAHKNEVADLLRDTETRIVETLRSEIDQLSGETHELLDDRVRQAMGEVEDAVMRNISEMPLQASLTFPQHPLY